MQYRQLGENGPKVSVIAFGAWQIGDENFWGPKEETDAECAVAMAIDRGINLFDTAEIYGGGESERILARALADRRKDIYIASKVSPDHCAPDALRKSCEGSLKRLNTDCIDIYQVHWPFRHVPFEDAWGELARLREEGKIRWIGVSNFGPMDIADWFDAGGEAVSDQIGYNLLFRAPEYEIIPACRRYNMGVLAYMPLMQGLLADRWESVEDIPMPRRRTRHFSGHREGTRHGEEGHERLLQETLEDLREVARLLDLPMAVMALAWLLRQPGVTSVILGARDPLQLEKNLLAAEIDIGPAAVAQLNEITYPLKRAMGRNADMWQNEATSRIR